jgi:DNA-binding transcriptional ArsR family regulator
MSVVDDAGTERAPAAERADTQTITDSRVLAAMSHPVRRRLLDVLTVDGPSTASALAARTGQAVGNVSHHLKVLMRASLIEEAPGLARDRRERWWKVSAVSRRWSSTSFAGEPAAEAVADAADSLNLEHQTGKVRAWRAQRDGAPEWADAAFSTDTWLRLTPAELREFSDDLNGLLRRWRDRAPSDGQERQAVFVFAHGVPAQP